MLLMTIWTTGSQHDLNLPIPPLSEYLRIVKRSPGCNVDKLGNWLLHLWMSFCLLIFYLYVAILYTFFHVASEPFSQRYFYFALNLQSGKRRSLGRLGFSLKARRKATSLWCNSLSNCAVLCTNLLTWPSRMTCDLLWVSLALSISLWMRRCCPQSFNIA